MKGEPVKRGVVATLVLVVLVLTAACGGSGGGGGDAAEGEAFDNAPVGAPADAPDAGVFKAATVQMSVPRDDLKEAADDVVELATDHAVGGFLVSSVIDTGPGLGFAEVVIKVPSARFEPVVMRIDRVGNVTRQEVEGRDLSRGFLAAKARIGRARARIASLLNRLQDTTDAGARFQLQAALREAKTELSSLQRKESYIEGITSYSAIEVAIAGRQPAAGAPKPALQRAMETAKSMFVAIGSGAILTAGVVVPLGVLALVLYLVLAPVVRRLRRSEWPDGATP